MKIGLAVDNTLGLHLPSLVGFFKKHAPAIELRVLTSRFLPPRKAIDYDDTVAELSSELKREAEQFDLTLLFTAIPYVNNFFYTGKGGLFIISFSDWNALTQLPMSNGFAYLLCQIIIGHMDLGTDHNRTTGCINDFLWDKSGIDLCMKAAFICDECRQISEKNPFIDTPEFKGVAAVLDAVSTASRGRVDILLEAVVSATEAKSLAVFLCHNSADKDAVSQLNEALKGARISTWFDAEQIQPGEVWQEILEEAIPEIGACLVIVGDSGLGPWQEVERRAFIDEFANRGCRIIPVLIGKPADPPKLPLFLRQFMWVDLRNNDARQLARLIGTLKEPRPDPRK